ncbi:MAG: glycerophosphodiester phosphodiesterase [Actinomycetota bacterium]
MVFRVPGIGPAKQRGGGKREGKRVKGGTGVMRIRKDPKNGTGLDQEFLLVSHRGGRGFGPENTLQALRAALDFGVEMVETDVRMTGDGVPVIHHGPFVGFRLITRITAKELRSISPEVPTLREFLDEAAGRTGLNLEVKRCDPDILAGVLREYRFLRPPLVSSFDASFLTLFRRTGFPAELGLLHQYEPVKERLFRQALECGATCILPLYLGVDRELVETAKREELRVVAWTVNSPFMLNTLLEWGVDGIITDDYPRMLAYLVENFAVTTASAP